MAKDDAQPADDQPLTLEQQATALGNLELEFYDLKAYVKKVMGRVASAERRDRQPEVAAEPTSPCADDINSLIRSGTYALRGRASS